jgi:hypothetical protein
VTVRYVKLNVTTPASDGNAAARIYEFEVYGSGSTAGAQFFQDINYGGTASALYPKGDYASVPADVPNDWMSSLKVPSGWTVDTYADANFGGAVCTFTADTSWVGSSCNDTMSSFKIH